MGYIEVGEVALSLARRLSPEFTESAVTALTKEGTSLLERSGFLSRIDSHHAVARLLTDVAKEAMPAVQRAVGEGSHAGGDLLVVGKPFRSAIGAEAVPQSHSLVVYEPHQNITIHPNGQFRIDYPTPSGARIRSDHYEPNGNWMGTGYSPLTADGYGNLPARLPARDSVAATVGSQFGSRQMMFDSTWNSSRENFPINPVIQKFIRDSKPIADVHDLSHLMTRTVSTPFADGKLIGFDHVTGEALVTQDGFHSIPQLAVRVEPTRAPYPVKLTFSNDRQITGWRNPSGKLAPFSLRNGNFLSQSPDITVFAFSPHEVKLEGQSLADILELDKRTGLRAMGGYSTIDGARIPIFSDPAASHASAQFSAKPPRAEMDILPRSAPRPEPAPPAGTPMPNAEEIIEKYPHLKPPPVSRPMPDRPFATAEEIAQPRPYLKPPPPAGTPMPIQPIRIRPFRAEDALKDNSHSSPTDSAF